MQLLSRERLISPRSGSAPTKRFASVIIREQAAVINRRGEGRLPADVMYSVTEYRPETGLRRRFRDFEKMRKCVRKASAVETRGSQTVVIRDQPLPATPKIETRARLIAYLPDMCNAPRPRAKVDDETEGGGNERRRGRERKRGKTARNENSTIDESGLTYAGRQAASAALDERN